MKFKSVILFCLCSTVLLSQKKKVQICFTYIEPYCGGARPTEEMEQDAQKRKVYANKTIVYISSRGKLDSATTNSEGKLQLKLRKGTYSLYEQWRYNMDTPNNYPIESFDRECLKIEWEKMVYKLEVGRRNVSLKEINTILIPCSWQTPCLINGKDGIVPP
jgi:hypothetical protein